MICFDIEMISRRPLLKILHHLADIVVKFNASNFVSRQARVRPVDVPGRGVQSESGAQTKKVPFRKLSPAHHLTGHGGHPSKSQMSPDSPRIPFGLVLAVSGIFGGS